ncbi:MAG: hypothetical protein IPG88_20770 [Gemmatimonadetes bacterium]|nr:hypothetical protein [Gemmatimonadota bacterium]
MHRAAAVGHGEAVLRALVEHGARVDLRQDDGASAYQLAVRVGNTGGAAYLASIGADIDADSGRSLARAPARPGMPRRPARWSPATPGYWRR